MRVISFIFLLLCCVSCNYFFSNKKENHKKLDTVVNFTKVDVSPTFIECRDKIDEEKIECFRITIHNKIAAKLAQYQLKVKNSINEIIQVELLITNDGKIQLQEIKSSETIKQQLHQIDSLIQISVNELPKVFPAIKRGIPVATQYSLPIKIQLKE